MTRHRLLPAILLASYALLGCASAPRGPDTRMRVSIANQYRDPVDVTLYCGYSQVGKVRWLMPHDSQNLRVQAGLGCDIRFTVEPSIDGGPFTFRGFDSGKDYATAGHCRTLSITAGNLITNSAALPAGCR